jgi:hypothetical protein
MTRLRFTVGGQIGAAQVWSNTLDFSLSGSFSSLAAMQTFVNNVRVTLLGDANFKAGLCADSTMVTLKALLYPSNTGPATLVAEASGTPVPGSATSVHAPQVCIVASLRTSSAGRSFRGRTYVPLRSGVISSLGVVSSAGQSAVAAYVNSISTAVFAAAAMQSIASAWVVYSPKLGTMTALASIQVGTQCDTIRHRNNNRGEAYTSFSPLHAVITPDSPEQEESLNAVKNTPVPVTQWSFVGPSGEPGFVDALLDVLPLP